MPRPRKAIPDLYWLEQKKTYCVNLNGKRRILGPDRQQTDLRRLELLKEAGKADAPDEVRDPLSVPTSELKVAEVVLAYLKRMRPGMDQRHVTRIYKATAILIQEVGEVPAQHLAPLHLLDLRGALVKKGEYSRRYINHLVSAIKTVWRWAVENTLVTGERARALLSIRALGEGEGGRESAPRLPADPAVVEKTIPHLPPVLRVCVRLLQMTGMRPDEALAMRRCDVSTGPGEKLEPLPGWLVNAADVDGVKVWLYVPARHKTKRKGKVRIIALGKSAQDMLAPLLAGLAPEDYVFSPKRVEAMRLEALRAARKTPVQPSQQNRKKESPKKVPGDRYDTGGLDKVVKRACEAAGVVPWTPYQLRHGRAVAVADIHGDEVAGDVLGHSESSTVTRTYTRTKLARLMGLAAREG